MRSPVPAVASPSMCEVRGLYAATPAEAQRERVNGLRTLISVGLKRGTLKQEIRHFWPWVKPEGKNIRPPV